MYAYMHCACMCFPFAYMSFLVSAFVYLVHALCRQANLICAFPSGLATALLTTRTTSGAQCSYSSSTACGRWVPGINVGSVKLSGMHMHATSLLSRPHTSISFLYNCPHPRAGVCTSPTPNRHAFAHTCFHVLQLLNIFPTAFEFNEAALVCIADAS